ncbi:uncharacterized protein LOC119233651 isoform X1 [Talpa occidentalis]|uniref:uncharacterized protein LOC119233651 isoform X1 n=1 Tax=Talpa occidentalis TaxID=50954 RepID=UPI00188EB5F7|nr:uncharacterized protein LOC119233651 isoform X1 [Talpa occidentalis]
MLFLKLATEKALAEARAAREKQYEAMRMAAAPEGAAGSPGKGQPAVHAPCSHPPLLSDSEWLDLSAEEQLAWAKNTQDPRIAVGFQSPLEKKIKSLGGVHSPEARKLLAKKFQQENETLDKLKAMSFDLRFAKAVTYYSQRHRERLPSQEWEPSAAAKWETEAEEGKPPRASSRDKPRHDLVPERELEQIRKHVHRAERARGLRDHRYRRLPQKIPSEPLFTKTLMLAKDAQAENTQKTQKTKMNKHKVAWAKEQIKRHQERMVRGRSLTEQRNKERARGTLSTWVAPPLKPPVVKPPEEAKEYEWVTAYPIAQPYQKALIEVTILREKSKKEYEIKKRPPREVLCIPPFLKSQLKRNKVSIIF